MRESITPYRNGLNFQRSDPFTSQRMGLTFNENFSPTPHPQRPAQVS